MIGDPGPYTNDEGDVWVPRMYPYLQARRVAAEAHPGDPWIRLHYVGKAEATLLGFSIDCRCEDVCERRYKDDEDTGDRICAVPAWHFRLEEP